MNIYPRPQNYISTTSSVDSTLLIQEYSSAFSKVCKKDINLIHIIFPTFRRNSITFYFSFLFISIFLGTLIFFFDAKNPLYIQDENLLIIGLSRYHIANKYEYYRLLTATFFHANIWSLMVNIYYFVNIGRAIEMKYGAKSCCSLMLLSTIGGNILMCATVRYENVDLGIAPILIGFVGMFLAEIIINYKNINDKLSVCGNFLLTFLLLYLIMSLLPHNGSFFCKLGGFVGGLCYFYIFQNDLSDQGSRRLKFFFIGLLMVYLGTCIVFIIFF